MNLRILQISMLLIYALASPSFAGIIKPIQTSALKDAELATRDGVDRDEATRTLKRMIARAEKPKVILLPFETEWGNSLSLAGKDAMRSLLAKNGIDLVDRNISETLRSELIAIEQGGMAVGSSYDLADYAIKGSVRSPRVDTEFSAASYNDKGKQILPPRCTVTVKLDVGIVLLSMNPLAVEKDLVLEQKYRNVHNNVRSCGAVNIDEDRIGAVAEALDDKSHVVGNLFTTPGFIIGHRVTKRFGREKHLFQTQLKKSGTYKPGSKAVIITKVQRESALGDITVETLEGPYGKVSKTIGDEFVWIEFSKKEAAKIFFSDEVRIIQHCNAFCKSKQYFEDASR